VFDQAAMDKVLSDSVLTRIKGTTHNKTIKQKDIALAIQRLSPWKAPGPDGVHGFLVKKLQGTLIPILKRLYNELWNGKVK
jgi:hypothetical protein